MKRAVALALVGTGCLSALGLHGQGALMFSNYAEPYVPIVWDISVPGVGGPPVGPGEGVTIEVWWGLGTGLSEEDLIFGDNANWSSYAGYTDPNQLFVLPEYQPGETWTLQLRASGVVNGESIEETWQCRSGPLIETSEIADQSAIPPELPMLVYTPGFLLAPCPEPTTLTLLGIGSVALLMRQRQR